MTKVIEEAIRASIRAHTHPEVFAVQMEVRCRELANTQEGPLSQEVFEILDANKDGIVTKEEFADTMVIVIEELFGTRAVDVHLSQMQMSKEKLRGLLSPEAMSAMQMRFKEAEDHKAKLEASAKVKSGF